MINVNNFELNKTEIHQTIGSIPINDINVSISDTHGIYPFFQSNSTAITLKTTSESKIQQLNTRKKHLLEKRNNLFDSFSHRLFNHKRNDIKNLDDELDNLEEQLDFLVKQEFQAEITAARVLLKKVSKNVSKFRSNA